MIVAALFTKNNGDPAVGEALGDIDLFLFRRTKVGDVIANVWAGVPPTNEVGGGLYSKPYAEDTQIYDYFAYGHYTGATDMDSDYSLQQAPMAPSADERIEGAYTLRQVLRLLLAVLASKSHGGGTFTPAFRDSGDTKDRVSAIVDAQGNRTAVVLDVTD